MKHIFTKCLAVILCVAMLMMLASCSLIENIKERALREAEKVILDTPDEAQVLELYNTALENGIAGCTDISCSVNFNVRDAKAQSDDENAEVELLSKAGKQLTTMIMSEKPGSSSETITADAVGETLLRAFDAADMLHFSFDRNYVSEKVTDEKGDEVKDENGDTVTEQKISDNLLELVFYYYNDTVVTEASTDENGSNVEAVTERTIADAALIEEIFGEQRDKDAILAEFDCVKDYLQVNDYSVAYTDCRVTSEIDLDSNALNNVKFEKNMSVTAAVTGVGSLAALGDFTVTFNVNEETAYTFNFPETAEE